MADSVDVDDMDASLFGSFSRSQNQRRQSASLGRKSSGGTSASTAQETTNPKRNTTEQVKETVSSSQGLGLTQSQKQEAKSNLEEKPQTQKFGECSHAYCNVFYICTTVFLSRIQATYQYQSLF